MNCNLSRRVICQGAAWAVVVLAMLTTRAWSVTIDTVPVGNAGNGNDSTGLGAVGYDYRIGTCEVTVAQYSEFLNAVAATDTYGLYNTQMATVLASAGISRSGVSGSYSYSPIGSPQHPVTFVNWGDAARFTNWMQNGQPTGLQSAGTTEDGAYTLNGATSEAALLAITRNAGATWVIPTESEWYKAAYHKNDGATSNYWDYPTSSDSAPTSEAPAGGANSANFRDGMTGFAVTGSNSYDSNQNYLTDVGAYVSSGSPYGTFDQAGNVWEWNEALISDGNFRGIRAGSWFDGAFSLGSFSQGYEHANGEYSSVGFRVAMVPEPSTLVLATLGLLGTLLGRRGRRAKRRQTPAVTFPRG